MIRVGKMNKKGQALVEFIIILPVIIFIIMLLVDFMTIFSYKNKLESNMNNVTILYKENKIDEIKETNVTGAAQPQLPIHIMSKIKLLNPPIELQNEFADFVKLIDKSKFVGYFTLNIFYVKSSHFHHPP